MSMIRMTGAALAAAALLLAGCSKGPEKTQAELEVVQAVAEQFKRRRTAAAAGGRADPGAPGQADPALYRGHHREPRCQGLSDPQCSAAATAIPARSRSGAPRTMSRLRLRQGMVIATRGLGGGLLSARGAGGRGRGRPGARRRPAVYSARRWQRPAGAEHGLQPARPGGGDGGDCRDCPSGPPSAGALRRRRRVVVNDYWVEFPARAAPGLAIAAMGRSGDRIPANPPAAALNRRAFAARIPRLCGNGRKKSAPQTGFQQFCRYSIR